MCINVVVVCEVRVSVCSSIRTRKSRSGSRCESTAELCDANHPGNLMSRPSQRRRPAPPFLKRYTIADFANTRAYQESTASLISASAEHGTRARSTRTRFTENCVCVCRSETNDASK